MPKVLIQGKGYVPLEKLDEKFIEIWDGEMYTDAVISPIETDLVKLEFENGLTTTVPSLKKLKVFKGNYTDWVEAKNLKKKLNVLINNDSPEFDFLSAEHAPTNNSHSLGVLCGALMLYRTGNVVKIPSTEFELRAIFEKYIPSKWYSMYEVHKAKFIYKVYEFKDTTLLDFLGTLANKNDISLTAYTSKNFLRGFFQTIFSVADVHKQCISIKGARSFLQETQKALMLFGVRAYISRGLLKDTLTIRKLDLYNYAQKINILEPDRLTKAFINDNLESYRVMNTRPLTLKLINVTILNTVEYKNFVVDSQSFRFMRDGLICYSERK